MPVIFSTLAGIIVASLATFFASRIPAVLMSLGLAMTVYKGLQAGVGYVIQGVQSAAAGGANISFYGTAINGMGYLGAAGVFDAVNIILSGYVAVASVKAARVVLAKMAP
jgi:hypothetical protein